MTRWWHGEWCHHALRWYIGVDCWWMIITVIKIITRCSWSCGGGCWCFSSSPLSDSSTGPFSASNVSTSILMTISFPAWWWSMWWSSQWSSSATYRNAHPFQVIMDSLRVAEHEDEPVYRSILDFFGVGGWVYPSILDSRQMIKSQISKGHIH